MRTLTLWLLLSWTSLSAQNRAVDLRPDVNLATQEQFEEIRGVGPVTARLIVGSRRQLGGFRSYEEINAVPKLSRKAADRIRRRMKLEWPPETQAATVERSDSR